MLSPRCSGILLHVTSLPSPLGAGDLGDGAYRFVDFLRAASQRRWQVLPLTPTTAACGYSPYSSTSAFAGNAMLLSPQRLVADGLLEERDLADIPPCPPGQADYRTCETCKDRLLDVLWQRLAGRPMPDGFDDFCGRHAAWLDDYALFEVIRHARRERAWTRWPADLRDRQREALDAVRRSAGEALARVKLVQFLFHRQWTALRSYCNGRGVRIIGDLPFYVAHDSADVWAHRDCFKLDSAGHVARMAGTPPDYFSRTGQLWGNPVYDWTRMRKDGYSWWLDRMDRNYELYDLVRIDHFRGIVASWQVPAGHKTAVRGRWVRGPGADLLEAMSLRRPRPPVLAEDLGTITAEVRGLIDRYGLPGMKPLLFAFNKTMPRSPYIPHNIPPNSIVYTGTHDNNTARGWFESEADATARRQLFAYLGREVPADQVAPELVRLAMLSPARTAIIPMQDLLNLDGQARMNHPGAKGPNWLWRVTDEQLNADLAKHLADLTKTYGRR